MILHGVQVDKYMPGQPVEGWIDVSPANVRFMAAQGFDAARVSMAYAGVEPQPGHFDRSYIDRFVRFDHELAGAGVYDLIDMMQGEYSTLVGGDGFPPWMALTNGEPNTRAPFAGGYLDNPAEEAVWDNFWANTPTRGMGLQDHYIQGLQLVAHAFARSPGLLALEILNEPWPGSPWATCFTAAGCPAGGFDQTSFTSFYRRVIPALRSADRLHLIAYEPNLLFDFGYPTRLGVIPDNDLVFTFHDYCLAAAPGLPPNPAASAGCDQSENNVLVNAEARAREGGGALLMDEWGNTTDLGQVHQIEQDADRHMVGWTVWAYEDCCNSSAAIVADGAKAPTAPENLRLSELEALVRPYPKAIAGTPLAWSYDPTSDAFALAYSTHPVGGGTFPPGTDTEIELPALHYPTGYNLQVRGARVLSAPDANLLRLTNLPGETTVRLRVTSARHHPAAPGPFTWPAAAGGIASADCPASSRNVLRIGTRGSADQIVTLAVFLDGRRVALLRAAAIERITLPAGLADGTVITLRGTRAGGGQVTSSQMLFHCQTPRPTVLSG